jgi:cell division topological specificity factor
MANFFDRMLGRSSEEDDKGSGATAKDRLKMVLTHDRIQVSPEKLKEMRAEIIAVIAKYVPEIDPDSVDISIEQTDRYNNRIVAQIPFSKGRGEPSVEKTGNSDLFPLINDDSVLPSQSQQSNSNPLSKFDDDDETIAAAPKSISSDTLSELEHSDKEESLDDSETKSDKQIGGKAQTDDESDDN